MRERHPRELAVCSFEQVENRTTARLIAPAEMPWVMACAVHLNQFATHDGDAVETLGEGSISQVSTAADTANVSNPRRANRVGHRRRASVKDDSVDCSSTTSARRRE